jgi:hypothetical protein
MTNMYSERKEFKNLYTKQQICKNIEKNNKKMQKDKCLPYPHTKMAQCPQCAQKYNTRGMAQVRQFVRESSPKLGWQTLNLKNKTNKRTKSTKTNNEGCLPQALSLTSFSQTRDKLDYITQCKSGSSTRV